jgi:cell division protein FtsB
MTQIGVRRFFYFVLSALAVILLIGGKGILNIRKIHSENLRIESSIEELQAKNANLEKEIDLLRFNQVYQEKVVREVLGFTRDDELIYEFN